MLEAVSKALASLDGHLASYKGGHQFYRKEVDQKRDRLLRILRGYGYAVRKEDD